MRVLLPLLLAACAHPPLATGPVRAEGLHQFALTARGHTFAGQAAMVVEADSFRLQALAPTGGTLFEVHGDASHTEATAPEPAMAAILERLPFHRDLSLLTRWRCPADGTCDTGSGRLTQSTDETGRTLRWRGPGGPATVVLGEGRAELTDPRRGYRLVVVGRIDG